MTILKKILSIAGSDSSGGAGIQADITTITNLGGLAMTAITAVTAQNESKVYDVEYISDALVQKQIEVVINCADVIKIGMLGTSNIIHTVSNALNTNTPIIIDPVMVSTSGYRLLSTIAVETMVTNLFPKSLLVTPNIPEAETLSSNSISNTEDMIAAGKKILKLGPKAVLIKGGHLIQNGEITNVLITQNSEKIITHEALKVVNTHGTGCRLSAAIACKIAQNFNLEEAVHIATQYVKDKLITINKIL